MNASTATIGLFDWSPDGASSVASRVDHVFIALVLISVTLLAVLFGLNIVFLVRYRRGSPASRAPLRISENKLEAGWITATTLVFLGIFFWGGWVYLDESRVPPDALRITVVGRQWMWDIRHPNGRREFDTLHVPANQPVQLLMTTEDVIHSFYVPAFRLKADLVPGKQTNLWFEPTQTGRFHLFCAEFCGTTHSGMTGDVILQAPEDYAAWLAAGNPDGADSVGRGRRIFLQHGCSGCHDPASAIHAPLLQGVFGRIVPLSDGTFVRADERYLRDSILQPRREIAAGFEPVMPSFEGIIPETDLLDLLAYLKSLRDDASPPVLPQPRPTITP